MRFKIGRYKIQGGSLALANVARSEVTNCMQQLPVSGLLTVPPLALTQDVREGRNHKHKLPINVYCLGVASQISNQSLLV